MSLLDRRLRGLRVHVIDTETTGFAHTDGLVEIGVVAIPGLLDPDEERARPVRLFQSFVDPGVEGPWAGTRIHGITPRAVDYARAPRWPELYDGRVKELLSDPEVVLCGHNAPFDRRFLHSDATPVRESGEWLDTARILKRLAQADTDEEDRTVAKLGEACAARWIPHDGHRAMTDAMATAQLLCSLIREAYHLPVGLRPPAQPTLGEWLTWQRAPRPREKGPKVDPRQASLFTPGGAK